jgi:hypothetical protein
VSRWKNSARPLVNIQHQAEPGQPRDLLCVSE